MADDYTDEERDELADLLMSKGFTHRSRTEVAAWVLQLGYRRYSPAQTSGVGADTGEAGCLPSPPSPRGGPPPRPTPEPGAYSECMACGSPEHAMEDCPGAPNVGDYPPDAAPELTPAELAEQAVDGIYAATTEAEVREWGNRAHARGILHEKVRAETVRSHVTYRLAELEQAGRPVEGALGARFAAVEPCKPPVPTEEADRG